MRLIISILILLCLTIGATARREVSLAYDYESDDMSAFRLYGSRAGGEWQLLAANDGGTNRGFTVQVPDGIESDPSNVCRWGKRTGFRVRK